MSKLKRKPRLVLVKGNCSSDYWVARILDKVENGVFKCVEDFQARHYINGLNYETIDWDECLDPETMEPLVIEKTWQDEFEEWAKGKKICESDWTSTEYSIFTKWKDEGSFYAVTYYKDGSVNAADCWENSEDWRDDWHEYKEPQRVPLTAEDLKARALSGKTMYVNHGNKFVDKITAWSGSLIYFYSNPKSTYTKFIELSWLDGEPCSKLEGE